jgi:hypothetical protein
MQLKKQSENYYYALDNIKRRQHNEVQALVAYLPGSFKYDKGESAAKIH